jgi:hypothetical protein
MSQTSSLEELLAIWKEAELSFTKTIQEITNEKQKNAIIARMKTAAFLKLLERDLDLIYEVIEPAFYYQKSIHVHGKKYRVKNNSVHIAMSVLAYLLNKKYGISLASPKHLNILKVLMMKKGCEFKIVNRQIYLLGNTVKNLIHEPNIYMFLTPKIKQVFFQLRYRKKPYGWIRLDNINATCAHCGHALAAQTEELKNAS